MPRRGAFATWEAADWWLWWCGGSHGRSAPTFERCEDMKIPYFLYCVAWWSSLVNAPMLGYLFHLNCFFLVGSFSILSHSSQVSQVFEFEGCKELLFSPSMLGTVRRRKVRRQRALDPGFLGFMGNEFWYLWERSGSWQKLEWECIRSGLFRRSIQVKPWCRSHQITWSRKKGF